MNRLHAFAIGLAIGSALLAAQARAAEPAVISFSAPTKYTTGEDIPAGTAISYGIFQGKKGEPKVRVATVTDTTATISTGLVPGVEYCFTATAIIAGVGSAQSAEACKLTPQLVPQTVVITVR